MNRTILWSLSVSFLAGCASVSMHTPEPVPISESMPLSEFRSQSSVSLINSANDPDHKKWTESTLTFVTEQLEQRGGAVVEDSPLQLNLEVIKVKRIVAQLLLAPLAMPEGCEVAVRVETGNGYVQEYASQQGAYFWQKACDKAVTQAVVDLFNDQKIRRYLEFSQKEDLASSGSGAERRGSTAIRHHSG